MQKEKSLRLADCGLRPGRLLGFTAACGILLCLQADPAASSEQGAAEYLSVYGFTLHLPHANFALPATERSGIDGRDTEVGLRYEEFPLDPSSGWEWHEFPDRVIKFRAWGAPTRFFVADFDQGTVSAEWGVLEKRDLRSREDLDGAGISGGQGRTVPEIRLPPLALSYASTSGSSNISLDNIDVVQPEPWDLAVVDQGLYHFRHPSWKEKGAFWVVDLARQTVTAVGEGSFGTKGATGKRLDIEVEIDFLPPNSTRGTMLRSVSTKRKVPRVFRQMDWKKKKEEMKLRQYAAGIPVLDDESLPEGKRRPPSSAWQTSQSQLYQGILAKGSYDVLIAPFQVEGFAVDRIGRSLMMLHLYDALERTTDLNLPSPVLVQRALGGSARHIPAEDAFRLADAVESPVLIRCFVGHDRKMNMRVRLLVHTRSGQRSFSGKEEVREYVWEGLAFSDEKPPAEVFRGILAEVLAKLDLGDGSLPQAAEVAEAENLALEEKLEELAGDGSGSPVEKAFRLQVLGSLSPGGREKEIPFERSIVALNGVSPSSPDYRFLKAFAYHILKRRPAALAVLGEPRSMEEKALYALLQGDLPGMTELVAGITRPYPALMLQTELTDLRYRYAQKDAVIDEAIDAVAGEFPAFGGLLVARLRDWDRWHQGSDLEIMQLLDEIFPSREWGLESLLLSSRVTGEMPGGTELHFALYNHYQHVLVKRGLELYTSRGSAAPERGDVLELLYAHGRYNMNTRVWHQIAIQGLYDRALEMIDAYEKLYFEDPLLLNYKSMAIKHAVRKKPGAVRGRLMAERERIDPLIFYWSQGQNGFSSDTRNARARDGYVLPSYEGDFPRRHYWPTSSLGDRLSYEGFALPPPSDETPESLLINWRNWAINLEYTFSDFHVLRKFYNGLKTYGHPDLARALVRKHRHRFRGHPSMSTFVAEALDEGDSLEERIAKEPNNWRLYFDLGKRHISSGDFKEASRTFMSFPGFRDGGSFDRVTVANDAYAAALELYLRGAVEDAVPLFRVSAELRTGSAPSKRSSAYLAIIEGDLVEGGRLLRDEGNRYKNRKTYTRLISVLHMLGAHEEADALFASLRARPEDNALWNSAVTGKRIMGVTDAEVHEWFREKTDDSDMRYLFDGQTFAMAFLVDRPPSGYLTSLLEKREDAKEVFMYWYTFARNLALEGNHHGAYRLLDTRLDNPFGENFPEYSYALPDLAWYGAKAGYGDEVEKYLAAYRGSVGEDFYYHLAEACLHGGRGDATAALASLRMARRTLVIFKVPMYAAYPWYQLCEATERILAETGNEEFSKLLLQWTTALTSVYPGEAWVYAIKAAHTTSTEERSRAITKAVFLDRQSLRVSRFPKEEIAAVMEKAAGGNPFVSRGYRSPGY